MKSELLANSANWQTLLADALAFYELIKKSTSSLTVEQTGTHSADIYLNGIEIGSYGLRQLPNLTYRYGTALALPRFAIADDLK